MPITADWLFQNHTAQQVTIQLLVRALSSSEYLCYVPPILDTQYWRDIAVEPVFFFFACLLDRERFTMQWEARFACV